MSIVVPTDAPSWMSKVTRQIEAQFTQRTPKYPVQIPSYSTTGAGLPPATEYPNAFIWVEDHSTFAISDGTHWRVITLGTAL